MGTIKSVFHPKDRKFENRKKKRNDHKSRPCKFEEMSAAIRWYLVYVKFGVPFGCYGIILCCCVFPAVFGVLRVFCDVCWRSLWSMLWSGLQLSCLIESTWLDNTRWH